MLPVTGYEGALVGVLGLGRSGLATARALAAGGALPICWDDAPAGRDAARAEGFRVEDLSNPPADLRCALYVISPGVPHLYPAPHPAVAYALRNAIPLDNDIGLYLATLAAAALERLEDPAALDLAPPVVAVTGTNGKSTTAALIHHLLTASGRPAALAGNIGRAVFDLPPPEEGEVVVLEISSYQAELMRSAETAIAVLTNLSADHLDRHAGLGGYFAAKARLFDHAGVAIIGVDETEGLMLANRCAPALPLTEPAGDLCEAFADAPVVAIAGQAEATPFETHVAAAPGGVVARHRSAAGGAESGAEHRFTLAEAPALKGAHNAQNAAAAAAAGLALGLSPPEIQAGFDSFPGLPHRMQTIAAKDGVAFVNDSKATNADAAEKALQTFERIRWILGGVPKDGGIDRLIPLFGKVTKAYLIGQSSDAFAVTLSQAGLAHERCGDIATAVARAYAEAEAGETVLLAPAAASFDQFRNFELRGDAFAKAVNEALGVGAQD